MRPFRLTASLALAAALLTGCGGGDEPQEEGAGGGGDGAAAVITIVDFGYEVEGPVEPGSEVTVVNEDSVGHTVTSDEEGLFDLNLGPGEEGSFTAPAEAGEYSFFCIPHPNMVDTLVVE